MSAYEYSPRVAAAVLVYAFSVGLLASPSGCAATLGDGQKPEAASGDDGGTSARDIDSGTGARYIDSGHTPTFVPPEIDCEGAYEITVKSEADRLRRKKSERVLPEECYQELDWTDPDVPTAPRDPGPPEYETFECAEGYVRVHVRDIWSSQANPTLGEFYGRPISVMLVDTGGIVAAGTSFGARPESEGCDWYSTCVVPEFVRFGLSAVGPSECASTGDGVSGDVDISAHAGASDVWIWYEGINLQSDYGYYGSPVGAGFRVTSNRADVEPLLCPPGDPPSVIPEGFTKLHLRWPWGDPNRTGYPGSGCGEDKLGIQTPPYPSSMLLKVSGGRCLIPANLEFENGDCPWYSALIPNHRWPETPAETDTISLVVGQDGVLGLFSPAIQLPPRTQNEFWFGYVGAPDNLAFQGTPCMNYSNRAESFAFFTENPGPGYASCGGTGDVMVDPCSPPLPDGFHTVHVRYLWAGQKTFTFFPKPEFMPQWIMLELGDYQVICYREQDRPWFNCPVPDDQFFAGQTWRMVDKTHTPEWNTVLPRDNFPATAGEYWLRWHYGKPDIPLTNEVEDDCVIGDDGIPRCGARDDLVNPPQFKFYDFYPDGVNGDWSATGEWDDKECAPKPPTVPPTVGFGGWFPYDETGYAYPFGASLARTFPRSDEVQELLNFLVQERYEIWRNKYIEYGTVCGPDTARVRTDPPETVSEGQGYGIAMSAAIGDKPTFEQLWNFTRHHLSQGSDKYCGGLMGWMWDGECRPRDQPATPGESGGNDDSAFDGDVDIAIGLVYAARQWPEYTQAAVGWLLKMQCEVNTKYDGVFHYPTPGDTWNKNCQNYPNEPCNYTPGRDGDVNMSYYPPGYFRVFGDFLATHLNRKFYDEATREQHRQFWYRTAETVYEMYERCYDNPSVHPGLAEDFGFYTTPCSRHTDNYNWARALWRVGVDGAWFGHRTDLPENTAGSSQHYPGKTRIQAKVENIQDYFTDWHIRNPPEPDANRFSTICRYLNPSGDAANCDPAYDHNSYFVNTAMTNFVPVWDNGGKTTPGIRREALEEAVSASIQNDRYYQEAIGVYTLLFLTGNFPNPLEVP